MNQNKDQGGAAVRGEAVAETNLAAAMLSIPVEVPFEHQGISQRKAYMAGAEQVRAKAAGLVSARAADAPSEPSEPPLTMAQVNAIRDTIKPGDGWDGDDWDFALANAVAATVKSRAADALDSQPTESKGE